MLGEAMPLEHPELFADAERQLNSGDGWIVARRPWLAATRTAFSNVLALRPPANKLEALCVGKKELPEGGKGYPMPALTKGKYLRPEYLPEVTRLWTELEESRPNLVVALGNAALWALCGQTNIGSVRGTITEARSPLSSWRVKVLPTYHPAAVLRQWAWRPIVVVDLMKVQREGAFPEIRRPARQILVDPTIEEVVEATELMLAAPPPLLSCDTETHGGQISMISFAPSPASALVIPFHDARHRSYWAEQHHEEIAVECMARLLESPIPKLWQNGMYDFQYVIPMRIKPRACHHDLMLLHHSLYPEMRKGLGFLGSVYTDEPAWKLMRRERPDTEKKDE